MLCRKLDRRGVWGRMDTCVCTAESLRCSPETITTLLIGYTPMQNVFGVKNNNKLFLKRKNKENYLVHPSKFSNPIYVSTCIAKSLILILLQ